MNKEILAALIFSSAYLVIFLLGETLRKFLPRHPELSRKAVHICAGLISILFPYFITSHLTVLAMVIAFGSIMWISKNKGLLQSVHGVERKSFGSLYYPLAIYLIFFLTGDKPAIYLISILVLTISDAFAALIGCKYGVIKYQVEDNTKSLEGSVVFFFLTFLAVHLPLLLMTDIGRLPSVLIPFMIAIIVTGFEAISPSGSDNIIIPFGVYFLLKKLTMVPLSIVIYDFYLLLFIVVMTALLYSLLFMSGLIGVMLLNFAAITLCNFYWFFPLFLTQAFFYLVIKGNNKEKTPQFSLKLLFYLGILPTILIFIANTVPDKTPLFLPYLVSIAAEIPIAIRRLLKTAKIPSLIGTIAVITLSCFAYLGPKAIPTILLAGIGVATTYVVNLLLESLFTQKMILTQALQGVTLLNPRLDDILEYRKRFISTIIGVLVAFTLQEVLSV